MRHEPSVHNVDMNPIGAGLVDRGNFLTEPPQISGKNRWGHNNRLHVAPAMSAPAPPKINRSIALAKPSLSLVSVTRSACACTSGMAFPIAMLRPPSLNIG